MNNVPDVDMAVFRRSMPNEISNSNVVLIDTHNFTTTSIEALNNGANEIVPLTSVKGGVSNRITMIAGDENQKIKNHPKYMNEENVKNQIIGIDSWNGSSCVHEIRGLINKNVNVYLGSLTNAPSVAMKLQNQSQPVLFVLAGSDANVPPEDVLTMQCIYNCLYSDSEKLNLIVKFYEQLYNLTVYEVYDNMYDDKNKLGAFGRPVKHATKTASQVGSQVIVPMMNNNGGFEIQDN